MSGLNDITYVNEIYVTDPFPAIRKGNGGEPIVRTAGGTQASGTITFADNPTADDTITINGVVFTFVASGATGNEINIGVSLDLTLDNMVSVLQASVDPAVALATYTENGVSVLTITYDTNGVDGNAFTLAASADTVSGATLTGGQLVPDDTFDLGPVAYSLSQNVDQDFQLGDGGESQRKFIYMLARTGSGNAVLTPDNLTGGTTITFDAVGEYVDMRFIGGSWVVVHGTATVA